MAYFGGTISARPWSKIDVRFATIFLLSFCGIAGSIFLAQDLPMFKREISRQQHSAALTLRAVENTPRHSTTPMLVASENIPAGSRLTPSMFRMESRPTDGLEQQVMHDVDEITGTFTRVVIAVNTPLLRTALSKTPIATDITNRIPAGYRAVAIPVNVLTGVEGWVRPGAAVDVIWSTEHDNTLVVSTIVENAKVLSVERSLDPETNTKATPSSFPNHITLLVSSADAQKIQLAKASGSLNLSLRGSADAEPVGSSILTSNALLAKRDHRSPVKGKVTIDGQVYVLQEQGLVPLRDFERTARMEAPL